MRRVVWSQDALDEFDAIIGYIARDNPATALKVAERIEDAVHNLAAMPTGRRGRVAGTYEKVLPGLPYIIAYALEAGPAGEEMLAVLRVIHGARNWPARPWPEERPCERSWGLSQQLSRPDGCTRSQQSGRVERASGLHVC